MRAFFCISLILGLGLMSSCMKDKPEAFPTSLVWNPDLAFPLGVERFGLNAESGFDTTLFEIDPLTLLPLWTGKVEVLMEGRLPFDISSFEVGIEHINRILFRVNLYNGFPNEVMVQAYFVDESYLYIDSMFSEGPIPLPPGTPFEDTIRPAFLSQDAVFEKGRIEALEPATEIILRAVIKNPDIDTALIPFYPFYYIDMEIGIMTDLTLEF